MTKELTLEDLLSRVYHALRECSEGLAEEVGHRYAFNGNPAIFNGNPTIRRRYDRDMKPVTAAGEVLKEIEDLLEADLPLRPKPEGNFPTEIQDLLKKFDSPRLEMMGFEISLTHYIAPESLPIEVVNREKLIARHIRQDILLNKESGCENCIAVKYTSRYYSHITYLREQIPEVAMINFLKAIIACRGEGE